MNIVLVHFHLKPGGVTSVIRQQANALSPDHNVLVLAANDPKNIRFDDSIAVEYIPGLAYDELKKEQVSALELAEQMIGSIGQWLNKKCDVIHIHNPLLAKNEILLDTIEILAEKGYSILCHVHDFAEDGRPNLFYGQEYPEKVHYATINSRDYHILKQAGLCEQGLHFLDNMVSIPQSGESERIDSYVLYPVRAIRRKNIGEAVLLSIFFPAEQKIGITLPPNSQKDLIPYQSWIDFVQSNHLSFEFDLSNRYHFFDLMNHAKYILTTSINEGFGFSFLEPWLFNKAVVGRDIPSIVQDFKDSGVEFPLLYSELKVPVEWIDYDSFLQRWDQLSRLIGQKINQGHLNFDFKVGPDFFIQQGTIDFGLLNEPLQKQVIEVLLANPEQKRTQFLALNPLIKKIVDFEPDPQVIKKNAQLIGERFNQKRYLHKLEEVYQKVQSTQVQHKIDQEIIIRNFYQAEFLQLLKWG